MLQPTSSRNAHTQLKRPKEFQPGASVSVPVIYNFSGERICPIDVNVSEWCMITLYTPGGHCKPLPAAGWSRVFGNEKRSELLARLQDLLARLQKAVAKALALPLTTMQRALTSPSCSIQLTEASAKGIAIALTTFSEKILDVDLGTTRPFNKNRQISKIKLPNIEDRLARLKGWQLNDCFWIEVAGPPSNRWLLNLSLKRHSYLVKPSVVTVELRSMGCDVIGEPGPVEPYVFATFSKEVIRLFENCEFGVFDFKAYRNSGQVGRGFVLRIKIFEPRDELGELDEVSGFAYWLCW